MLDDGFGGDKDYEFCQKSSQFGKIQLEKLGVLISNKKVRMGSMSKFAMLR